MQLGEAEARDEPDKTRTRGSRAVRARSSSPSSAGRASSSWARSPPPRLLRKSHRGQQTEVVFTVKAFFEVLLHREATYSVLRRSNH